MADGVQSRCHKYVVPGGDCRADAVLPLEAHGDIDRNENNGENGRLHAVGKQFLADLWSDHFGAAETVTGSELRLDRIDRRLPGMLLIGLYANEHAGIGRLVAFAAAEILEL